MDPDKLLSMLTALSAVTAINWAWMKYQRDKDLEGAVQYGLDAYVSIARAGGLTVTAAGAEAVAQQIRLNLLHQPEGLPTVPTMQA